MSEKIYHGLLCQDNQDNLKHYVEHLWLHMLGYELIFDRERSGSVVECLARDCGTQGSSLTGVIALCP